MIPILYAKNATDFDNNGIGHLRDTVSCKVSEKQNGDYTLTLQYPMTGAWYDQITEGAIIKAKANETSALQLFRIYKSSKPLKGIVTFYAEHISYDLQGLPIASLSMTDTTAEAALSTGFAASLLPHGFTAWSNIETLNSISFTTPRSLRNLCGGKSGSVLDVWGGEFEFDNFLVKLHKNRGANRGVVINYGKNLIDAKQECNISECYTHFFPYAIKKNGETEETVMLPEGVIELIDPENIGHTRAYPLDMTNELPRDAEINQETLRKCAEEYIEAHHLGVPEVNITLSLMQIWDSPEYVQKANGERISLCDTVTVRFHKLGIDAKAKVIKTEYDSLAERYSKIEVGDARSSLADTVVGVKESIDQTNKNIAESKTAASAELEKAIEDATNKITGNSGGYIVHNPPNNPQEILIMDTPYIETAMNIWRWNNSGFGHSSKGYNGPYGTAITMDGRIVADFITAGTLKAINITGCTITGGSLNVNDRFTVDTEGTVRTEGEIIAKSGIIGECEIEDGKLVIPSAHIKGPLTIGQLPDTVAQTSDIPTNISQLTNDSGYQNESEVVSIIDGKITADYIEALGIKVNVANITGQLTASKVISTGTDGETCHIENGIINLSYSETFAHVKLSYGELAFQLFENDSPSGMIGSLFYNSTLGRFYAMKVYGEWVFELDSEQAHIYQGGGKIIGRTSYRSDYGAFAIETDYDGANWAAMLLNASTSRNNIFMGSWEFANGEPSYGSDRNIKTDIEDITDKYSTYFDNLRVKTFKYIKGNSGRKHVGLIAQDAFDALEPAELSSQDFAGVCVRNEGTDQELWTIRSGEFVALCIYEIQKLKKEVARIKAQNEV